MDRSKLEEAADHSRFFAMVRRLTGFRRTEPLRFVDERRPADDPRAVVTAARTNILFDPGVSESGRADLLCADCGQRIHYPEGEWGDVACGCDELLGWIIR